MSADLDYIDKTIQYYQKSAQQYEAERTDNFTPAVNMLQRFTEMLPGQDVLEIGFGTAQDARWFIQNGYTYTGIEPTNYFFQKLQQEYPNLHLINEDLRKVQLPPESLDGIWAVASLLHFNDLYFHTILSKFRNWLRLGGILLASVKEGEGSYTDEGGRFYNLFTREKMVDLAAGKFELVDFNSGSPERFKSDFNWLDFYLKKI